jgi:hypothetical protein
MAAVEPMARFELTKWYADAVTDRGDAIILYSAELRWRGPAIHYTSLLLRRHGCRSVSRFSLRDQTPPDARNGVIEWTSRAWSATARWSQLGRGTCETLFDSPAGSLEWNCVAPRAWVEFRLPTAEFRGFGYVECLRLSVAPWRLPIQRLRWGRFINAADALVWIDWSGPYTRQVLYLNGATDSPNVIDDCRVELAGGRGILHLEPSVTLREGHLGATALSILPNVDHLFPARILKVNERKWLSRATLCRPGLPDSVGMAIHEVVEWP